MNHLKIVQWMCDHWKCILIRNTPLDTYLAGIIFMNNMCACLLEYINIFFLSETFVYSVAWVTFVAFDRIRLKDHVSSDWSLIGKSTIPSFAPLYTFISTRLKITSIFLKRISKYDQTTSPSNGFQFDWNFHMNSFYWLLYKFGNVSHWMVDCMRQHISIAKLQNSKRDFPNYVCTSNYKILISLFPSNRILDAIFQTKNLLTYMVDQFRCHTHAYSKFQWLRLGPHH